MPYSPEDQTPSQSEHKVLSIDFGAIDFPSDALSVKHLRHVFPQLFDKGLFGEGYGSFFFPVDAERPLHLVRLTELLSAERTVADYAFYNAIDPYPSKTLDEEARDYADRIRTGLEQLYAEFKLADSPETARLLIRHIEEQGAQQGKLAKSGRGR